MADLTAIIPAKWESTRVPNKNFRPFLGDLSLVDLVIGKLKATGVDRIVLSSESREAEKAVERHGIEFDLRSKRLCHNDTPFLEVFNGVYDDCCYGGEDVLWAQVIDPLFDEYLQMLECWERREPQHDSCVVVYPRKGYLLNERHEPLGFGFGPWHVKSQSLPLHYEFSFTASILTEECVRKIGYHIGARPLWYEAKGRTVDIDTEEDFALAGKLLQCLSAPTN